MVKRWDCYGKDDFGYRYGAMSELNTADGEWVRYADHEREVAALQAKIAELNTVGVYWCEEHIKGLTAERDALQERVTAYGNAMDQAVATIEALQKRCGELEKALAKYGRHTKFCYAVDIWDSDKGCTCGFAALRPADGPTSPTPK